jgi:hypothetical protein
LPVSLDCPLSIAPLGFSNFCGAYSTTLSSVLIHCIQNNESVQEDLVFNRCKFTPVFSVVRVARSLVLCVCFVDRCLSLCTFSFGHCVVCCSSIYDSAYPFGIFKFFLLFDKPNTV